MGGAELPEWPDSANHELGLFDIPFLTTTTMIRIAAIMHEGIDAITQDFLAPSSMDGKLKKMHTELKHC